jgi:hypothetical protein
VIVLLEGPSGSGKTKWREPSLYLVAVRHTRSRITRQKPHQQCSIHSLAKILLATDNSLMNRMNNHAAASPWSKVAQFAVISLVCFLLGMLLLFLMVWKAAELVALGLIGRLYYIVLLPLGLSAAGFLFGVVHSYARYSGKQFGGTLTLGGPIIAFLLVVILGFVLVPDLSTFPVTVYVQGPGGPQDIVLRNSGEVYIDLGGDRRHVAIGDQGQAYFPAISANFRGQEVPIWVRSDKFEASDQKFKLDGRSVYLAVHRRPGKIVGQVESEVPGCISGAKIAVAGIAASIDPATGHFELTIPGDKLQDDLVLEAAAAGCDSEKYNVVPNSNELVVTLRKRTSPAAKE